MPTWRGARGHHCRRSEEDLDLDLQKKLVWLLRHKAPTFNIHMDPGGFASVHDILALREFSTWSRWKLADISRVVDNCGKGRLELQGAAIRAVQGHSLRTVTSAAEHWEPDQEVLMHGTTLDKWRQIRCEGLCRLARNHVHLSADFGEHLRDSEVLVTVNVEACLAQGLLFERSRNGVILTTGPIPPTCFLCVEWSASGRSSRSFSSTIPGVPALTLWAADRDRTHEAWWESRGHSQQLSHQPSNNIRLCRDPVSSEQPGGGSTLTQPLNLARVCQGCRCRGHQGRGHGQLQHPPSSNVCRGAWRPFWRWLRRKLRHQRRKLGGRRKLRHQRRKLRRRRKLRQQKRKLTRRSKKCQKR